jgi:hypothetical protein
MKRQLALAVGVAVVGWTTASFAQDTTAAPAPAQTTALSPPPPLTEHTTTYAGPNRYMIGTGLITFGVAYLPAVIVAADSSNNVDHHLYVPVVGPWLDLANRPACGPGSISCDNETTNKILIALSGVFQGLGVITTVMGFLVPEHNQTTVTTTGSDKPTVHFTPTQMGAGGYGAAAFGTF